MSTRADGFGYIGLNKKLDEFYIQRIIADSNIYGVKEISILSQETINENSLLKYIQNIKDYGKNVVTYWRHTNYTLYNKFIQLMHDNTLCTDNYPVILLEGSLNLDDLLSIDLTNNKGNYHIRGYDLSFDNEDSVYYKNHYYADSISPYEEVFMYIYIYLYKLLCLIK